MGVVEHTVWIHAVPARVWSVYGDPLRIPQWQTGSPVITEMTGSGDRPGSTYVSRRGPGSARTTVLAADPPTHLATRTDAYFGLRLDVTSSLHAESDGTRLTLRVETRWPRGLGIVGRLVELAILSSREANKELANLKALVEGDTPE